MPNHYAFQIKPIPDENFFGLVTGIGILTGCETYSELYSKILGNRKLCPSALLPRNLHAIREFLPQEYTECPDLLCFKHTALPYFQHFVNPANLLNAKNSMMTVGGDRIQNFIGLTGKSTPVNRYLKYCRACANEQWKLYDRSTWLTSHQLPGVDVCYKHGLSLINSEITTSRLEAHFKPIKLPHYSDNLQAEKRMWSKGESWDKTAPNRLIAQISHELLTWQPIHGSKGRVYKSAYINAGFGHGEYGNWELVGSLLRTQYGDLIPRKLGVDFTCDSYDHWIHQITITKNCVSRPILHILIIGAMFDSLVVLENSLIEDAKKYPPRSSAIQQVAGHQEKISGTECELLERTNSSNIDKQQLELKRQTIINELVANPLSTRTKLKRKFMRCYAWLLQNDNEWMQFILPPKIPKNIRSNSVKNRRTYTSQCGVS